MPTTPEAIVEHINAAATAGFRNRLISRGQARSMIWRNGELPPNAPTFSQQLSYDLHSYGYSLLALGLRLLDKETDSKHAQIAFSQAATALESAIVNGINRDVNRHFHFVMTAASYHLAHFSARAYSLLGVIEASDNFSPIERVLALLIRRNVNELRSIVFEYRISNIGNDERIAKSVKASMDKVDEGLDQERDVETLLVDSLVLALTDEFFASMALFISALEREEKQLLDEALNKLGTITGICGEMNLVPHWWVSRVSFHLLLDLWSNTFYERLPKRLPSGNTTNWSRLREFFIVGLMCRSRAEIDLWPSQIAAATRVCDESDNLVVSLPTSAGKTRIAELCILRCLASNKRAVVVTPLRALSAQMETTLKKTFGPLGISVSALYGSIGVSDFDEDAIRDRDIAIATPEKLDFALRNDPSLLDDVGLLIFDEGHMIGINEREIRYEAQVQRLLNRKDASKRRIVCLSAILPEGDQLEDFAAWLQRDQSGEPLRTAWRPTRLWFGTVVWRSSIARLSFRVGDESPWIPRFFEGKTPPNSVPRKRKRKRLFPDNQRELCLATAWRLVEDGQTVLIYCPERRSVEPYGDVIVDLHARGALRSLFHGDPSVLNTATVLGEEWLGADSVILKCLRLGVAMHHGALPTPYRKEVERLLQKGALKVTISSPTLAQGLNLSATALVMHSLHRHGNLIDVAEFNNVSGRAGRAFIDTEGLVIFPMFKSSTQKQRDWNNLSKGTGSRNMESGLVLLVTTLLRRMHARVGGDLSPLMEYVLNNTNAWSFPEASNESPEERERAMNEWEQRLATLDTAIFSLTGDIDIHIDDIESTLDEVLRSSLWQRRLLRRNTEYQKVLRAGLLSRSRFIWSQTSARQRKGYFLAGVGLQTGHILDAIASVTN